MNSNSLGRKTIQLAYHCICVATTELSFTHEVQQLHFLNNFFMSAVTQQLSSPQSVIKSYGIIMIMPSSMSHQQILWT